MINLREIEEAIKQLKQGSATYNNCMKLASLYIIEERLKNEQYEKYNNVNYKYYPQHLTYSSMPYTYEKQNMRHMQDYNYKTTMPYEDEDLIIRKQNILDR